MKGEPELSTGGDMTRTRAALIFLLLAVLASSSAFAILRWERGREPIPPEKYVSLLGVGMDVNWAKSRREMQYYSREVVEDFKEMGFTHVRIRARENLSEEYLRFLDRVIDDCLEAGLIPVLANTARSFNGDPSEGNMRRLVNWWAAVAERYRDRPYLLSYDLIAEPSSDVRVETLNEFYRRALAAIREVDPHRIVMLAPADRSNPLMLRYLWIPKDDYIMVEWHFYASGPSKRNPSKLWTNGTEEERRLVEEKVGAAVRWRRERGVQVWVGAWMPGNYNKGNDYSVDEQVRFATFVSCALRRAGIPYAVNADTHFYDMRREEWRKEMIPVLDAVLRPECGN